MGKIHLPFPLLKECESVIESHSLGEMSYSEHYHFLVMTQKQLQGDWEKRLNNAAGS